MGWVEFWDGKTTIYANARHEAAHYEKIAKDIAALVPRKDARVLDYGCGAALSAGIVADACAQLYLVESAATVRESLKARFANRPNIKVLSPEELAALPGGSIDLFVVNSVLQYFTREQTLAALEIWRAKLAPGGKLVLADVIPPNVSPVTDAASLLKFAAKDGFFIAACTGLVRTFFSDYRRLRSELGLQFFEEAEMLALLRSAGYSALRQMPNLGHNQNRMAFSAVPLVPAMSAAASSSESPAL